MTKIPCKNGCIMCGMCCVLYTIDDEKLQKKSYVPCKNLIYENNHAKCSIHATIGKQEPQTCREYQASKNYNRMWFDNRFAAYKKTEYMRHMVWCSKNGYLAHLPIMKAIKKCNYKRADDVFKYFIRPYLICLEGTVASDNEWLSYWEGLENYIIQASHKIKQQWLNAIKKIKTKKLNINQKRLELFKLFDIS